MTFRQVDYRTRDVDTLPELLRQELETEPLQAVWWTARRPKKRWHLSLSTRESLVFTTASQFEQILWLPESISPRVAPDPETEACRLLQDYRPLFEGSEPIDECARWSEYRSLVLTHIQRQENEEFPQLLTSLPAERPVRELGYEHRGLEKGLENLAKAISLSRSGELTNKERDKIDLDYYHLLEHHLEREQEAIYPAILFFNEG